MDNFIVSEDYYIIYNNNNRTQEKIYVIDKKSGAFQHEVFVPTKPNGGLFGVRNICYDSKRRKIYALAYKKIFEFDIDGKLTATLSVDLNGSRMVVNEDGHLLVEASPNAEDDFRHHHLALLDTTGKILQRFLPYKPQGRAFVLNEMGMLKKTEKGILYSKPFGNTIFLVKGRSIEPIMALDLGDKAVKEEEALNVNALFTGELSGRGYLRSDAETIGDLIVFSFLNPNQKISFGFYDFVTGEFTNSRNNTESDVIAILMQFGKILGKNGDTLLFELSPERAKSMMYRYASELKQLKAKNAALYQTIQNICKTETAGLLSFYLSKKINP